MTLARLDPARTCLLLFDLLEAHVNRDEAARALSPGDRQRRGPARRWSAFHGTYLDLALRARRADTLVLCGGSTDVGVAATAFAARDFDYNLLIISDACTSPEQDNHAQFLNRIFPRMARIRTTAQVIQMFDAAK